MDQPRNLIVILGPTASGKSALGVRLAKRFKGVVISADSRQVYRGLNVGTAKITKTEMRSVPHFLLDVASPQGQYSVARYFQAVRRVLKNLPAQTPVFLVGGTPYYIRAVTEPGVFSTARPDPKLRRRLEAMSTRQLMIKLRQLDPQRLKRIDTANRRRLIRAIEVATHPDHHKPRVLPSLKILKLGLQVPRTRLYQRIDRRVDNRLTRIIIETRNLHRRGLSWKRLEAFGLEYRFAAQYLRGMISRSSMAEQVKFGTHDFARRQLTWWRKDPTIHWISSPSQAARLIVSFLS